MFRVISLVVLALTALTTATDYFERLDLTPLPLGSLLASFNFHSNETLTNYVSQNYRYFPRALGQVLQHAHAKELHIRFTTGRWDTETWGARPWDGTREGGTGVELWAWIQADNEEQEMERWKLLNQGLSGLFCASLNFVDETKTTKPLRTFQEQGMYDEKGSGLRLLHGVLPGEVVCTENLTPFLKLLPCKGKAGVASLLDGHKLFDSAWQSMSIDVVPKCYPGQDCLVEINQGVDMVLNIARSKRPRSDPIPRPAPYEQLLCDETKSYHSEYNCYPIDALQTPSWNLNEVFGRPCAGACPLSVDKGPDAKSICLHVPHEQGVFIGAGGFEVRYSDGQGEKRCWQMIPGESFDFDMPKISEDSYRWPPFQQELVQAERTMTGHGAASGGMRTVLGNKQSVPVTVVVFESLPWFLKPFMHSLQARVTGGQHDQAGNLIGQMYYRPAIDRERGTQIEIEVRLPANSEVTLTYDFEKSILRYTEYPPDANRGFIVAPAVVRILGQPRDIYVRTTSLLLALPTPDFSMPYNVIILTSTVLALAFGSLFNILSRRFVLAEEAPASGLTVLVARFRGRMIFIRDRFTSKSSKKD